MTHARVAVLLLACFVLLSASALAQSPFTIGIFHQIQVLYCGAPIRQDRRCVAIQSLAGHYARNSSAGAIESFFGADDRTAKHGWRSPHSHQGRKLRGRIRSGTQSAVRKPDPGAGVPANGEPYQHIC